MFGLVPWRKTRGNVRVWRDRDDYLTRLRDEFDALWDRFLGDWERGLSLWDEPLALGWESGLEDRDDEYVFRAELPGFEPEDFDVKVSGNTLTVRAERKEERKGNGSSSYQYGAFHRMLTLPEGIREDQIQARYHSGVLEVHLPKSEECKGRRIEVKAS